MRKLLTTLVTLMVFAVALPVLADGDHDKPKKTTTTTLPEETTTTVPLVEVCRDGVPITIPYEDKLDSDEPIWHDFDRDECKPPRTTTSTTVQEVIIEFPPYSVGYICPGTDGVVVELPWGTYEDMWPTPESAKLYGCPVVEEIPVVLIPPISTPTTERLVELPFTGIDPGLGVLAGLALLGLGGLLVRRADA